jgi:hypothetical protein
MIRAEFSRALRSTRSGRNRRSVAQTTRRGETLISYVDCQMNNANIVRMLGARAWAAIEQLVDRLQQKHPDESPHTIVPVVHQNHARFDGRPVRDFVPLFVERGAGHELAQLAVLAVKLTTAQRSADRGRRSTDLTRALDLPVRGL